MNEGETSATQRTLVVATMNRGKLREVRDLLSGLPVHLISLDEFPGIAVAEETGSTFAENAAIKALYYARATGHWALADDSGLEVDALDGAPGVRSARYAGSQADDRANNMKLLNALRDVPSEKRTARFFCAMALSSPEGVLATAAGRLEGFIGDEPRGANGFGYDPHFYVPELGMTAAQMPPEQKNLISHRGQALRAILPEIERQVARAAHVRH